jgi:hypothetical protein
MTTCEICGRPGMTVPYKAGMNRCPGIPDFECYRIGHTREKARADAAVQQARVNATLLMEAMDWLQDPSAYFGTDQADDFNKRVAKVLGR